MGTASHVRGGAGGDGPVVPGAAPLVGAGVERSLPGVERAVPEKRLMGGRVLLLGAGGMLGHDLVATAPPEVTLVPLSRAQLDITQGDAVAATLGEVRPDVVINAAGYTAVDRAESERDIAMRVNGAAVGALGRNAHLVGARVIQFSSDYVFDGTATQPYSETSVANPVNAYGASKLAGARALAPYALRSEEHTSELQSP